MYMSYIYIFVAVGRIRENCCLAILIFGILFLISFHHNDIDSCKHHVLEHSGVPNIEKTVCSKYFLYGKD